MYKRQVLSLQQAALRHGRGGLVEGVQRLHIAFDPALVPALAAQAGGVRRAVKDAGDIVVVHERGVSPRDGRDFVKGAGYALHAAGGVFTQPALSQARGERLDKGARSGQQPRRQQHEYDRGREDLKKRVQPLRPAPGAQDGEGVRHYEADDVAQPSESGEHARYQPGEGVGHGVEGLHARGGVHGQAEGRACRRASRRAALERAGHDEHQRQHPTHGEHAHDIQPREGHERAGRKDDHSGVVALDGGLSAALGGAHRLAEKAYRPGGEHSLHQRREDKLQRVLARGQAAQQAGRRHYCGRADWHEPEAAADTAVDEYEALSLIHI